MATREQLAAEFGGTMLLVTAVIGSGIMGDRLSDDIAVTLLANTGATAAALFVLISILGPVSGAHFNPVVSAAMALRGEQKPMSALFYGGAQVAGGLVGTLLAHAMFDLPLIQTSANIRTGAGQFMAEIVATFCLLSVILRGTRLSGASMPTLVSLTIASAYWFTASTSFANPAVTIARAFTETFAGIAPENVPLFISAQCIGCLLAFSLFRNP
ncbi:MAG: MIP/aquaporin family protein [Rhizobiaceae bacterium]